MRLEDNSLDILKHPIWENISVYKKPAHLARFFIAKNLARFYPRSTFVGITGSVGKTTTTKVCLAVLKQKYNTISTQENLDSIFNIPITILRLRPNIKKVILEMGVHLPGEMGFYLSLIKPGTGIITRISHVHGEFLGGIDQIAKEKGGLIRQLPKEGFAILNWDDVNVRKLAKDTQAQVLFYGLDPQNCDVWADKIKIINHQTRFELNYGVERVEVLLNLLGRHRVYSALAAATLGITCGMSLVTVKKGLETVTPVEHRLELREGLSGWHVLDDTYNSSPISVEEALNVLAEVPARKRILVLGEMKELGEFSEQLHRTVAQRIYKDKIADLVLLGMGNVKFIADELTKLGFPQERVYADLSNSQMVSQVLKNVSLGDVILVKGSRSVKLDEVVKRLTKH